MMTAALACLTLIAPTKAWTASEPQTHFRIMWLLEPQAANGEVLQLKEDQPVTSARLLPLQLLVTQTDIKTADGKIVLNAGSELVRAASDNSAIVIACTIESFAVGPLESFFMNTEKYGCLVDDQKDGTFDRFFTRGGSNVGLIPNGERIPKKTIVLESGNYKIIRSEDSKSNVRLVFKYSNYAFISKWIIFRACISYGDWRCIDLADTYGLRLRDLPGQFHAYGGQFEVLEKNETGIKVRMLRSFSSRPMSFTL